MNLKEIMQEITGKSGAKTVFGPAFVKDHARLVLGGRD